MNKRIILIYTIMTSIWFMLPLPASSSISTDSPTQLLRSWLYPLAQTPSSLSRGSKPFSPINAIARFYEQRQYKLAWLNRQGLEHQGELLLKALENAAMEGLNPTEYHPAPQQLTITSVKLPDTGQADAPFSNTVKLDMALTQSFLKYTADLKNGRMQPDAYTIAQRPGFDLSPEILSQKLKKAIEQQQLETFFQNLAPRQAAYRSLKGHLGRYETLKQLGGWESIPDGPSLKPGSQSPRVPLLSRRLLVTGDLQLAHYSTQTEFDRHLEAAVKRYQHRNGMTADGIVGPNTLASLNISIETRIAQIKLNMERLRWLPRDLGAHHLMVNIPAFELRIVHDHNKQATMRVIVGRKKRQTPVMTAAMTYLELNPYWNIPQTIAREDILPKIQSDPQYLVKNSIQVFNGWGRRARPIDPHNIDWQGFSVRYLPYRLRQAPSPSNALGKVKFMFPNHHSIYIHDTPGKSLFKRDVRNFSSGCVRVEQPLELARLLLENQQWDDQRLGKALGSKERKTIVMKAPVPVHLVYFTAWADDETLHFRRDIYDRDQRLSTALAQKSVPAAWCQNATAAPAIAAFDLCQHSQRADRTNRQNLKKDGA